MADAPAGFHEAGAPWIEPWCEDHPGDVAEPGCMACLGESHDAWMHRAKAAEQWVADLEAAIRSALDLRSSFDADRGVDKPLIVNLQARELLEHALKGEQAK